jgi:hypothetical protein
VGLTIVDSRIFLDPLIRLSGSTSTAALRGILVSEASSVSNEFGVEVIFFGNFRTTATPTFTLLMF